ncbi:MAG: TRAM domain-containing protein [Deltaproteobacteria bacterium]|nr:TRAM domain-containing protein [Deltaproteobacteria bacterium]
MTCKSLLLIVAVCWGYYVGGRVLLGEYAPLWGAGGGLALGFLIILLEKKIRTVTTWELLGGAGGLLIGLLIANLFIKAFSLSVPPQADVVTSLGFGVSVVLGYLGVVIGMKKVKEVDLGRLKIFSKGSGNDKQYKILDTSVIIDGRIFDICETGFIEGIFVIPQFVLKELMRIADSSDPLRRTRGRRGLEVLKKIQKQTDFDVIITDQDFPKIKEVDHKLVALAHAMGGKIITNDVNLNEIAEIQGVSVINTNQLASALRPIVLPGETMNVFIQKEGKEFGQGVAYLDDGTMVVVKNGKKVLGKNIEVSVTSVLQTTAGRMIFAELSDHLQQENVRRLRD